MIVRLVLCLVAAAWQAAAESQQRNPLQFLSKVESPLIETSSHQINAFSRFDLTFHLYKSERRLKLSLAPNHDVIPSGASVTFLNHDGTVGHSEPLDRNDHLVYKGTAHSQSQDGSWANVGWARVAFDRDGPNPLFEGAFSVNGDTHHIQSSSTYTRTKHPLDPDLETRSDEFMVVFRDSDISPKPLGPASSTHTELRRRDPTDRACMADYLEFNSNPNHPVFRPLVKTSESSWGVMPLSQLFDKRQIDTQTGSGNTGVLNLKSTIGNSAGCPTAKKVALVGVATDCGYTGLFRTHGQVKNYVVNIMNTASEVWESTFNISLGLADLFISPSDCPGREQEATPWNRNCDSNIDIQDRLNLFSAWRGQRGDTNSHWTLLTKCPTGTTIGLAWLGQACVHSAFTTNSSGGSETVSGANVVVKTSTEWQVLAHETGHTFGAVHDCDSETCGDTQYVTSGQCCPYTDSSCSANSQFIMNPYTQTGLTGFSQCTVGNICSAILTNSVNTECLQNNQGITTVSGSQCGNGIVEKGEECDCGGVAGCQGNTCCDPTTCKFMNGAVCDEANQDCCNGCQFASKGTVCRPSSGTCDPAEKCPGNVALCPRDIVTPNGTPCSLAHTSEGAGDLACASGQCTSRNLQCQNVMGSYTKNSNDTYACDDSTCQISCGSPQFAANTCWGLKKNMLDGTPCGSGGSCKNGQCDGSSFGGEVVSWLKEHEGVVIGVSAAIGVLLLILVATCICSCVRRRKRQKMVQKTVPPPPPEWYGPPPPPIPQAAPPMWQGSSPGSPTAGPAAWAAPTHSQPWSHAADPGWRPPQQQSPSQGPQGLYGYGILGSRSPGMQQPALYPAPPAPPYFIGPPGPGSARYA